MPRRRSRHSVARTLAAGAILFLAGCTGVEEPHAGPGASDPLGHSSSTTAGQPAVADRPDQDTADQDTVQEDNTAEVALQARFVDAANGSDGASGAIDDPYRRPAEAMAALQPGDTLYFREGIYDDRVTGPASGTLNGLPDAWITLQPYPGESVTIWGSGEWGDGIDLQGSSYVIVEGFTLLGDDDSIHGTGVRARDQSHDIIIRNNYVENFGLSGIAGARSSRLVIEYNEVRTNALRSSYQGSGISLWEAIGPGNESDDFANVIRGNLVAGNYTVVPNDRGAVTDGNCIIVDFFDNTSYVGSTLIENNVCVENGGRGVLILFSDSVTVRNNTLLHNGWTPELALLRGEFAVEGSDDISFYNNLVLSSDGVAPYIVADDSTVDFSGNAFVETAVPPSTSTLLTGPAESVLTGTDPFGAIWLFRPKAEATFVAGADSETQSTTDACGQVRPTPGTIGALEPGAAGCFS